MPTKYQETETTSLLGTKSVNTEAETIPSEDIKIQETNYYDPERTAVGAGVLGLPFAIKSCGLIGGISILILVNIFTIYSLRMIVFLVQKSNIYSYEQLGETVIGKWFGYYMKALVVFNTVGTQTIYVVILGNIVPPILEVLMGPKRELHWIFYRKEFVSGIILLCVIFPLTLFKNIDSLAFASAFAILNVCYIVGLIIVYKFTKPAMNLPIVWFNPSYEILLAIPIMVYSHNCHIYVFLILKELKEPSHRRMEFATTISVIIYGFIYLCMGIFGYLSFYGNTKDNILLNFDSKKIDYPVLVGRIGITLTIIFSYPMILFACRRSLDNLFFKNKEFSQIRHSAWAAILCTICFLLGNLVPEVSTVFALIGASGSMQVMFILPSLFYLLYIVWEERKFSIKNLLFSILPFFIFIAGIILAIICTGVVIFGVVMKYTTK